MMLWIILIVTTRMSYHSNSHDPSFSYHDYNSLSLCVKSNVSRVF